MTSRQKHEPLTLGFMQVGPDNVTSAMCKHQQQFRLDVQFSALVHNFNNIISIGHLYRAGRSRNSLSSQILERVCLEQIPNIETEEADAVQKMEDSSQ
jgi:hypothetical protein